MVYSIESSAGAATLRFSKRVTSKTPQLKQEILRILAGPKYRPLDKSELGKALGRKSGVRMGLNEALRELERDGEIARIRKNRYVLPSEADLVTGLLTVHQAGYAFLTRENKPGEQDLFIAAENTGTAMHGDRVVARVTRDENYTRAKGGHARPEGRVIRILERAHETIVGTLQQSRNFFYVVPDDPRIVHNVYVQVPTQLRASQAASRRRQGRCPSRDLGVASRQSRRPNHRAPRPEHGTRRRHAFDYPEIPFADRISCAPCSRRRSEFRKRSILPCSKAAKICATNSS